MGFDCLLNKSGWHLLDQITGETTQIRRKENVYVLKMWVKQADRDGTRVDFHRQGQQQGRVIPQDREMVAREKVRQQGTALKQLAWQMTQEEYQAVVSWRLVRTMPL